MGCTGYLCLWILSLLTPFDLRTDLLLELSPRGSTERTSWTPHLHSQNEELVSKDNVLRVWRKAWGPVSHTKCLSKTGGGVPVIQFFTPYPKKALTIPAKSCLCWNLLSPTSSSWVLVAREPESGAPRRLSQDSSAVCCLTG